MSAKDRAFNKIAHNLFKASEELENFSPIEIQRKNRTMLCVSKLLDNPMIEDRLLVEFLMNGCEGHCDKVSQSTAYRDLAAVTRICGKIQLAGKNWYRYMIVEASKKGIRIAEAQKDAKGIAANADKIGKYTMADKEDDAYDWSQMLPPSFEPTDDVSILGDGFTEMSPSELEDKRKEMRSLFHSKAKTAEVIDVEIIEDND